MAKITREQNVRERRMRKAAKKTARKLEAAAVQDEPTTLPDGVAETPPQQPQE